MHSREEKKTDWTKVISSDPGKLDLKLAEIWQYHDLVLLLVKRDFISQYKQTILGPAWHFLQPLCVTTVFTIVFGYIARISTEGIPPFLFYMSGTIIWSYFSTVLISTSNTFIDNAQIFGKVYFPRLVVPVAKLLSNLIAFSIQFLLFISFYFYFYNNGADLNPNGWILLTPVLLFMMAGLGLGLGAIVSSLTTRYRDLIVLVGFGAQLFMYASPIIYPLSAVPDNLKSWIIYNPVTPVVEMFRHAFFGSSIVDMKIMICGFILITLIVLTGVLVFNRVERNFMDTV